MTIWKHEKGIWRCKELGHLWFNIIWYNKDYAKSCTLKNLELTGMAMPFWLGKYVNCCSSEIYFLYLNGVYMKHFICIWEYWIENPSQQVRNGISTAGEDYWSYSSCNINRTSLYRNLFSQYATQRNQLSHQIGELPVWPLPMQCHTGE